MEKVEVARSELTERVVETFTRLDVPQEDAALTADSLLDAEICGVESHGLMRVPVYARRLRAGLIAARPDIRIESSGKPRGGDLHAAAFDSRRIMAFDQSMKVGQKEEALDIRITALLNGRSDGSNIIADVECSGRVNASEYSLMTVHFGC